MRRRLLTIVFFLLAGAIVNLAVAWGCALWRQWPHTLPFGDYAEGFTRRGEGFSDWHDDVSHAPGIARITSIRNVGDPTFMGVEPPSAAEDILPPWAAFARPSGVYPPSAQIVGRIIDARGWPWISMWSGVESVGFPGPSAPILKSVTLVHGYLPRREQSKTFADWASLRVVPLAPIWPGFLANTAFYAVLLWLLVRGPFALRRFLRARRGLCPNCGYPVGHSAVCPECGTELPKRAGVVS